MDREMSLLDVFKALWSAKLYILFCTVICLIAAFIFIAVVQPTYKATMIVAPADG